MLNPLVTVIIPTKNAGSIFNKILTQVRSQKTDFDYNILIIDSGSIDETLSIIIEHSKRDPRIKLHQIEPSEFGHGKTRNLGVSLSHSPYSVFITHDALPANENWLSALIAPLQNDDNIVAVFGRHLPYSHCDPVVAHELTLHFDRLKPYPIVHLDDPARYSNDQNYRQFLHFYSDNNSALRKSVWQKIPYPAIDFAEDQAWAKLIIEAGYKKAYADAAQVFHSHSYSIVETLRRSFDESLAMRKLFGYKLCPHFYHIPLRTGKKTLKDWGYLLKSDSATAFFFVDLFRNLAQIFGYYLGSSETLSKFFGSTVSLDQAKKKKNNGKNV